jgi:hypothetical protein
MTNALASALEYIGHGWTVVPIPHRTKRPLREDWPSLGINTQAAARQSFNGAPQNIGVQLGKASRGLADVDLDTLEATRVAPYFLEPTRCFGRASKPQSHWLYYSNLCEEEDKAAIQFKYATGKGTARSEQMILELRIGGGGKGAQTVFPGSTHESGEEIEWDSKGEISLASADLKQRCARAAAAALLAANFPSKGARHDVGLTLGGLLFRCGVNRPDTELFAEAATTASGQGREKVQDVRKAARDAWDAAASPGGTARGYPALAETFGDDVAKKAADWLGYKGQREANGHGYDGASPNMGAESSWSHPKPIPAGLPPVAPFEMDFLPTSISPWALDLADRKQCPLDYIGVSVLAALGAMIGRKVGIRPKQRDVWTVVPNAWAAIIGAPGAMKSPAIEDALKPMRKIEAEATKAFDKALANYENELKIYMAMEADALRDAKKSKTRSFRDTYTELSIGDKPEKPTQRRYITSDTTYEKLGIIMSENPFGVMVHRDELMSLVRHLDKEEQCEARAMIMTSWGGDDPYTFDRVGRGRCHIPHTCLSIVGATQPSVISEYIASVHKAGAGDGLIQRFSLMTWPDPLPEWRLVDELPDRDARDDAWDCFERLDALDPTAIGAKVDRYDDLFFLHFSDDAQPVFNEWLMKLEHFLKTDMPPAMQGHFSKYRSLLPTLALIIHLSEKDTKGPVSKIALEKAKRLTAYFESHARRVYVAGMAGETAAAKTILHHIRKDDLKDGFNLREILRRGWSNLSSKEAVQAGLDLLCDLNWVAPKLQGPGPTGGRSSITYLINPAARTTQNGV